MIKLCIFKPYKFVGSAGVKQITFSQFFLLYVVERLTQPFKTCPTGNSEFYFLPYLNVEVLGEGNLAVSVGVGH